MHQQRRASVVCAESDNATDGFYDNDDKGDDNVQHQDTSGVFADCVSTSMSSHLAPKGTDAYERQLRVNKSEVMRTTYLQVFTDALKTSLAATAPDDADAVYEREVKQAFEKIAEKTLTSAQSLMDGMVLSVRLTDDPKPTRKRKRTTDTDTHTKQESKHGNKKARVDDASSVVTEQKREPDNGIRVALKDGAVFEHLLSRACLVGREDFVCDVKFPIADLECSRLHALLLNLAPAHDLLCVVDVGSRNGIRTLYRSSGEPCLHSRPKDRQVLMFKTDEKVELLMGSMRVSINPMTCVICMERARQVKFSCQHFVACRECTAKITDCPVCRKPLSVDKEGEIDYSAYGDRSHLPSTS